MFKILVMGMPASGKTTFKRYVFEGKEFNQLTDYIPTFGVHITLYNYKGSETVKVSAFDCGGQTSFIDTYSTDQWLPNLFSEVSLLFFMVDSSSKKTLKEAGKLFKKYLNNVIRYSDECVVSVLASKWDRHTLSEDDLKGVFKNVTVHPVSVTDGSARKVSQMIIDDMLEKRKQRQPRDGKTPPPYVSALHE